MKKNVLFIYPNQLFRLSGALNATDSMCIIEDPLFFGDHYHPMRFHKKKLAYHRATMKRYEIYAKETLGKDVVYFSYTDISAKDGGKQPFSWAVSQGYNSILMYDTPDFLIQKRAKKYAAELGLSIELLASDMFLTDIAFFNKVYHKRKTYLMATFYNEQRRRLDILMDDSGNPKGGKWSFDDENRKKIPKGLAIPDVMFPKEDECIEEARKWTEKHFPENPGSLEGEFYPINFEEAEQWLDQFLLERFKDFGQYEDAILSDGDFLFHSVLTPMLNIGLLTPLQIVKAAMAYEDKVPINSLEGFIRQVIGWREYMMCIYRKEGSKQRTSNFFGFNRKIPESFYTGNTGIPPIDAVIKRTLKNAYAHHIERLMVVSNFMLLCEFDPDEVYRWFMEMYVDAYDWVMVPNVYGMGQFADGGLICTKPYISGSNYIHKMSDFPKGDWDDIWDALYWRFLHEHQSILGKNPRMSLMVSKVKKMDKEKLQPKLEKASAFINSL